MYAKKVALLTLFTLCSSLALRPQTSPAQAPARDPLSVRPTDRVTLVVNDAQRIVLKNQHYPLATPANEIGAVPPTQRMDHLVLVLQPDATQETALAQLIQAQQTKGSPHFHQWLTPATFGEHFGISQNDLDQVVRWLERCNFEVEQTPASHRTIIFSGTVEQVESAFHTSLKRYLVKGQNHYANATDPQIPQALAAVVKGVLSLHDFRSTPAVVAAPDYTDGQGGNFLAPADWATIYGVNSLYAQYTGIGENVAVAARSDISLADVETFQSNSALSVKDPTVILAGTDPGIGSFSDQLEATLDAEWAGAIAPAATVDLVTAESGGTDGVWLAAEYAVDNTVAPILNVSYSMCEATLGVQGNAYFGGLWAEAASLGMSVFVSSGDSGAANCDSPDSATAVGGAAVNGLCSSPFVTCVGGTQFDDVADPSSYWGSSNGAGGETALSYIPELAWNESATLGTLYASGGGTSTIYSMPTWQAGPGVPGTGWRNVPDVSMAGATHDAYVVQFQGAPFFVGGTSAASPSLASLMALIVQKAGAQQGNMNPTLYTLANRQAYGGAAVFNDITSGNNSVPGQTGFAATVGYDLVTGLGSVNANTLAAQWSSAATPAPLVSFQFPSLAFGNQTVGTSSTQTVMLTNPGNAALSITAVALTGAQASQFSQTNTCGTLPATVKAPGGNCTFTVTYTPSAAGAASASLSVTDSAVGSPHLVSLTGTGTAPAVGLNPGSIAFGNQAVGTTSAPHVVTLTNSGTGTLTITSVSITGTDSSSFGENSSCGATVAASGTCTIAVTFTPTSAAAKSASLSVTDSASGSPHTVTLSGTGTAPGVSLLPNTIAFGSIPVGTSSPATVVTLTNTGSATLNITNITFTGSKPFQFAQTNTCGATLSGGSNCTISVTYNPSVAAAVTASLSVTDNATGSPHTVAVSGTGTATPTVRLSPSSLSFGTTQSVGTTSAAQTIHVTNTGSGALTITGITLAGAGANQYGISNTCGSTPATLNAGASCSVNVTYSPTASGAAQAATVSVADNASGSPQTVALSGTATVAGVGFNPSSVNFGNVPVGTTSSATAVTLSNSGSGALNITGISFTGTNPTQFAETNNCGATVAAGGSCTISVTFSPAATSAASASLSVADNAPGSPQTVALTGTGTAPAPLVSLSPSSVAFGNQVVNTTSSASTVTLKNTGNASLTISSVVLTGSNPGQFALVNPCGTTLAAGNSCVLSLTFAPTVVAAESASVTITDNAAGSPHTVALTGTGTAGNAPAVGLSPTSVVFGPTVVTTTTAAQTVTLTNSGTATLHVSAIGLAGTPVNTGQFAISGGTCGSAPFTVASAATCTVKLTYSPSVLAYAYALLSITDDAAGSPHSVSLSGTGTPALTVSPALIPFGSQAVNTTSSESTVTLTNNLASSISITSTTLVGANPDQFTLPGDGTCGASLAGGASCTITVEFTPTASGAASASLSIVDAAYGSPHVVLLTGTGTSSGGVIPVRSHRPIH